ncbi:hypothetical protein O6H91_17G090800 [Diphasiastrum complanatum]|uniref:Uncharacterized protein n=1 Tax=Diphasiastrum complanatum TaxID=34168 RepID=A0ACC2B946_DIPCM|nr:hypothetical protein O6H91_17G090800 [Diphasiastrum complanatum]
MSSSYFVKMVSRSWNGLLLLSIIILVFEKACSTQVQQCVKSFKFKEVDKSFHACVLLPTQRASLAWTYYPTNFTLDLAFSGTALSPSGWVGWGINLGPEPVMIGTNALIAFYSDINGSNVLPYKLTARNIYYEQPTSGPLDFNVTDKAVDITGTSVIIYAKAQLPPNLTHLNHIWNRGPGVSDFKPQPHSIDANDLRGVSILDITTGTANFSSGISHQRLKNLHGILSVIGWSVLLLIGVIVARHLRPFKIADPLWFYIHISCQLLGYVLGVTAWAIGLVLGSYSKGTIYHQHRDIGITIFILATLQVFGLLTKPDKQHKLRLYWNIYHHFIGYSTVILAIINIFKGFDILQPQQKWRKAYIAVIAIIVGVGLALEILTWTIYCRKRVERTLRSNAEYEMSNRSSHVQQWWGKIMIIDRRTMRF